MKSVSTQTQDLIVVLSKPFYKILCDFYQSSDEFYMTRNQVGKALGYSNPQKALSDIHARNADRINQFSVIRNLRSSDGKSYNTVVYSLRGVMEICRFSRQPKADEFMDFVWDVMETLFKGDAILTSPIPCQHITNTISKLQQDNKSLSDYILEHSYDIGNLIDRVDYLEEQQKLLPATFSSTPLIQRLIEKRQDQSVHGCSTYREVYKRMYDKKTWKRLITKYKHQHSVIRANKSMIVTNDAKILTLFNQTVHTMIDELEGK